MFIELLGSGTKIGRRKLRHGGEELWDTQRGGDVWSGTRKPAFILLPCFVDHSPQIIAFLGQRKLSMAGLLCQKLVLLQLLLLTGLSFMSPPLVVLVKTFTV